MPDAPAARDVTLFLLTLSLLVSFLDRNLLSTMFEPLRLELRLTDGQLGFLSGMAFSVCGALFGLTMGWLTDRVNRKWLLTAAIVVWSLATAAQGLTSTYLQLVLWRVMVGIGEAAGGPVAHSMICDLYPAERRGFALSLWNTAIPMGTLLGLLLGGRLTASMGWRRAFITVGLPGLGLALFFALCAREPERGGLETRRARATVAAAMVDDDWSAGCDHATCSTACCWDCPSLRATAFTWLSVLVFTADWCCALRHTQRYSKNIGVVSRGSAAASFCVK